MTAHAGKATMAGKSYELWVKGMDAPDGQISFAKLGALANSLQELVTRLGRQLDDRSGPGRTPLSLGRAAEIRLVALRDGSTKLDFEIGDPETMDLPDETHEQLAIQFEEIIKHVRSNDPPEWTGHLVGEATERVVLSLRALDAATVTLSKVGAETVEIAALEPRLLEPAIWHIEPPLTLEVSGTVESVSGRLEAVDLKNHKFRVRDDTGRAIRLDNVVEADEVGRLVGSRVIARGDVHRDSRGHLAKLDGATVEAQEISIDGLDDQPRLATSHPEPADLGISDDDLDAFLRGLRA